MKTEECHGKAEHHHDGPRSWSLDGGHTPVVVVAGRRGMRTTDHEFHFLDAFRQADLSERAF
jgi:hypothetical protein